MYFAAHVGKKRWSTSGARIYTTHVTDVTVVADTVTSHLNIALFVLTSLMSDVQIRELAVLVQPCESTSCRSSVPAQLPDIICITKVFEANAVDICWGDRHACTHVKYACSVDIAC